MLQVYEASSLGTTVVVQTNGNFFTLTYDVR